MGLVPIDSAVDDLISRKAREQNKSKADILREILAGKAPGGDGQQSLDPESLAKALAAIPNARPGSLAEDMKEMASTMMTIRMMQMMGQPAQAPAAPQHDSMDSIQRIFMLKELSKPSMYEMVMMQKMDKGEEPSAALKALADGEKETRELLKGLLEEKKETARQGEIDKVVDAMMATSQTMKDNYDKIVDYMTKGEHAPKDTIEGYIANALKEQLTDRALDAIDKGLFHQQEIITEGGGFNWKETLNRLIGMGEKWIEKMPQRTPPPGLVRRMDGTFVNTTNGQVFTPEQAAAFMQSTAGQPMQPVQPVPVMPPPVVTPPPGPEQPGQTGSLKKKANQVLDQLASQGAETSEQPTQQQQPTEPEGGELY